MMRFALRSKIIMLFSLVLLAGCKEEVKNTSITGYVVRKEYKPEGRCHDGRSMVFESSVISLYSHSHHHVTHHTRHHHHSESPSYRIYVANHQEIVAKSVTKEDYSRYKCGQKVTIVK